MLLNHLEWDLHSAYYLHTGGSKIPSGDYTYHVWTTGTPCTSANFNVTDGTRSLNDILLVGGGGGGGGNNSGGGGAGGGGLMELLF